jgi:NAD-dependent dihydropyrimidine dehydrogenase PreA subunit
MPGSVRVLYCHCTHADILPKAVKEEVLRRLCASGVAVEAVADLCELASLRDPRLKEIAAAESVRIAACYPRAVRSLFAYAGAPLPEGAEVLNMRTGDAAAIAGRLLAGASASAAPRDAKPLVESLEAKKPGQWSPWFPAIDASRCKNCRQCLNFCLFGVYGLSEAEKVEVQRPANCKTNCPACARVCPEVAIIFAKYKGGVIAGDEVTEETLKGEQVRVDPAVLRKGGLAALRQRGQAAAERLAKEQPEQKHGNQD